MAKIAVAAKKKKLLIKNYGLLWRSDRVFWGKGSNAGELDGRHSGRTGHFREQVGIYVLYDEGRRPIYVGQAGQGIKDRLFDRLKSHRRDHLASRWQYFSWFGLLTVNKDGTLSKWAHSKKGVSSTLGGVLNEIEGVLIAATEPAFNKQGAKFKGIQRYNQIANSDADNISSKQLFDSVVSMSKQITAVEVAMKKMKSK